MNGRGAFFVVALALALVTVARGGHEQPVYPSYYPHEIELASVSPEGATQLLLAGKIQAYVGGTPRFADPPPPTIDSVPSLGTFVIIRVNPSSPLAKDACAFTEQIIRDFAGKSDTLILHTYPVTPFHGDYLHHADLVDAARGRIRARGADPGIQKLRVRSDSALARSLLRPEWQATGSEWDFEVAEVDAAKLVASARVSTNSWTGPPWLRSGWLQAYLLLGTPTGDEKGIAEEYRRRLQSAEYANAVERINLERSLVKTRVANCHVRVAGYTVKREYFSTVFTAGVENIAYDSVEGLNSPMFVRTVKLKDFPWNGWLALGINARPTAAWNPIAGFTDDFGRLMWSAIGDTALIPSPYESVWMLNRISDVQSSTGR
jgi:hypothetical protein